jgi:hypothetical protein
MGDQRLDTAIIPPPFYQSHQFGVRDGVKIAAQVGIHHLAPTTE